MFNSPFFIDLMKNILIFFLILSSSLFSQENDPWSEYMIPGKMHELLAIYEGSFRVEISMWMDESNTPALVTVNAENKMILGRRFLEMKQSGPMMDYNYEAMTTLGFNTISGEFSLSALNNMGTGSLFLEGSAWEPASKTAILKGEMINPVNKQTIHVRQVIRFTDENTLLIENYDRKDGGQERKTIQYLFTRISK